MLLGRCEALAIRVRRREQEEVAGRAADVWRVSAAASASASSDSGVAAAHTKTASAATGATSASQPHQMLSQDMATMYVVQR